MVDVPPSRSAPGTTFGKGGREGDAAKDRAVAPRALRARELLGHHGRIVIEHDGALYELRLTRNNKLILTK